jgi:acyl-CoA thioesterase FadM
MDPSLPFTQHYRVRFDEAGSDGVARPSALVRYIQDVAWQHSEAAGFDRDWYFARGVGWLIHGVELELHATAGYGDTVAVTTRITGWRRMWARRLTTVTTADGTPVATARTDWVLLDTAGRPVRIPTEVEAFAPRAETFAPVRVTLDPTPRDASCLVTAIRRSDADPMGHLNNASYLDLLCDHAEAAGRPVATPVTIRLEYLRPALPGMAVTSLAWTDGAGLAYRLVGPDRSTDLLRATLAWR